MPKYRINTIRFMNSNYSVVFYNVVLYTKQEFKDKGISTSKGSNKRYQNIIVISKTSHSLVLRINADFSLPRTQVHKS